MVTVSKNRAEQGHNSDTYKFQFTGHLANQGFSLSPVYLIGRKFNQVYSDFLSFLIFEWSVCRFASKNFFIFNLNLSISTFTSVDFMLGIF